MAFQRFEYEHHWTNKGDFPTTETDETKVRADMQLLFDEIAEGFNLFGENLDAGEIPFTPGDNFEATDVQAAIEELFADIQEVEMGVVTANTIETDMIKNGQITNEKMAENAIDTDNIQDGKVTHDKLAENAVQNDVIKDEAVTYEKLNSDVAEHFAGLETDGISTDPRIKNTQRRMRFKYVSTNSNFALTADDVETIMVVLNNNSDITITIPELSFPRGSKILIVHAGSKAITVVHADGESLRTPVGNTITSNTTSAMILLVKVGSTAKTNAWRAVLFGEAITADTLADDAVTNGKIQNLAVDNDKIANDTIEAGKIKAGAVSTTYTGKTLAAADWAATDDAAPYTQALTISGISGDDNPIVDVVMDDDYSLSEQRIEAWGNVYRAKTTADTITFYATEAPQVDLPIRILCVRK